MSNNLLIAIIVTSIIALTCFIAIIIFTVWKCRSKYKKHGEKITKKFVSAQPTILKRHPPTLGNILLSKKSQQYYSRTPLVYTLPVPKEINSNQATFNNPQIHKKKKHSENMWSVQNSIPTLDRYFVWRPIENESSHEVHQDSQKNTGKEDQRLSFSDRQREPHTGSIRHLPSDNGKACKC